MCLLKLTGLSVVPDNAFGTCKDTEPSDVEETKWDESEEVLGGGASNWLFGLRR